MSKSFYALLCIACLGLSAAHADNAPLPSLPDPAKTVVNLYAKGVFQSYRDAQDAMLLLQKSAFAFLASPTEANLHLARDAWGQARHAWALTQAFRFYGGPIDKIDNDIDNWPPNEVMNQLLSDVHTPLTADSLRQRNGKSEISTGWYAVAFMLWGEHGARPASDYAPGNSINERRRDYLKILVNMLVDDMAYLVAQWTDNTNYAPYFTGLDEKESIGKILTGLKLLSASETTAPTDIKDYVQHLQGIMNVYNGTYPNLTKGAGIGTLVARADPGLDQEIVAWMQGMKKLQDAQKFKESYAQLAKLLDEAQKAVGR